MTNAQSSAWSALAPHQGDWMKKSLDVVGLSAKGMAEYLGVEPETVSRWINHKRTPDLRTLRLWAMRTGVPLSYLQTGMLPSDPDDGTPSEFEEKITVRLLASGGKGNVTHADFGRYIVPDRIAS